MEAVDLNSYHSLNDPICYVFFFSQNTYINNTQGPKSPDQDVQSPANCPL